MNRISWPGATWVFTSTARTAGTFPNTLVPRTATVVYCGLLYVEMKFLVYFASRTDDDRENLTFGSHFASFIRQYADPYYKGYQIGEYSFYNWKSKSYSSSYCKTGNCRMMDCHEPDSHWQLIGVFKEADGLYDWAEQLFKHEGVCVWGNDNVYVGMQTHRELWPYQCTKLTFQLNGLTLYMHTKPEAYGDVTIGLYTDKYCTKESYKTWSDYVSKYKSMASRYKRYSSSTPVEDDLVSAADITTFNTYMTEFKICQPCRAYNLKGYVYNYDQEEFSHDHSDEGGGSSEKNGYNCYDDAGYTNCNQCYKFQTKTDMSQASTSDLEIASSQGTILAISINNVTYGSGGYGVSSFPDPISYYDSSSASSSSSYAAAALLLGSVFGFVFRKRINRLRTECQQSLQKRAMSEELKESFSIEEDEGPVTELPRL